MDDLKLFTNGTDTFVAHSAEEAAALCSKTYGDLRPDEVDPFSLDPREKLTISDDGVDPVTKTAAEWIAEMGKPGLLCSTEF